MLDWESRAHLYNLSARIMRNILIDHSRKRKRAKRGGEAVTLSLGMGRSNSANQLDVLLVDEALERFSTEYPRQAHVVELRFFGGLSVIETCEGLRGAGHETSPRTVERDWMFAKAWLQNALTPR